MTDPRPSLDDIRTRFQTADDEMITYRPRAWGAVEIPFTDGRRMTRTEGALLDNLTLDRGMLGLSNFRDIANDSFKKGEERFPDNPLPSHVPADQARSWQGNDGHRDAFRHAYWSGRLAQEYGPEWARAFTTAHEGVPGNDANREAMDLYNNSIGIQIGAANRNATPEQLAGMIQQAVNQGKLVVVDQSGNIEWSDRVPVGQHGIPTDPPIAPAMQRPAVVPTQSENHANLGTANPIPDIALSTVPVTPGAAMPGHGLGQVAENAQTQAASPFNDPYLDRALAAAMAGDSAKLDQVANEFTQSPDGQRLAQQGEQLYAQQQQQEQQAQEQTRQGPTMQC